MSNNDFSNFAQQRFICLRQSQNIPHDLSCLSTCIPVFLLTPTVGCRSLKDFEVIDWHALAKIRAVMMASQWTTLPKILHSILNFRCCRNHQSIRLLHFPVRIFSFWIIKLNLVIHYCIVKGGPIIHMELINYLSMSGN
jgi:hypothetical protein